MTLQFILGRSGSGKTSYCIDYIRNELIRDPAGPPLVYLVPDQMTFQTEYEIIQSEQLNGMIRAQAFSFKRLAWRVLQETGGISRYHINSIGITILLKKIIENSRDELHVFKKVTEQKGFIEQVEGFITEFKRYCLTSQDLALFTESLQSEGSSVVLKEKLQDFGVIYEKFEQELFEKYIDSEDYLRLLVDKIPKSRYLTNGEILIDGFHSFTPQERLVVEKLMKYCKRCSISLTVDRLPDKNPIHELDLFQMPVRTYQELQAIAEENNITIEDPIVFSEQIPIRFKNAPALAHLERYFESRPAPKHYNCEEIEIFASVNRRAEVEGVAREIIKKVRDENFRWKDFAILVRNPNDYQDLIETLFEDHEVPVFTDQKRAMLNHPLIELIRSALDIIETNWKYESVFRYVKTELIFPLDLDVTDGRDLMDELENYILAYGIKGNRWYSDKKWGLKQKSYEEDVRSSFFEEEIARVNEARSIVTEPLLPFQKKMKKSTSVMGKCETLFEFLEKLNIPKKLEAWKRTEEVEGRLLKSKEHDQVWNAVIDLLDQLVELMGEEDISFTMFKTLVETGLESLKFSLVPPAMDQVLIGDIEHSRFLHVKCTFILGVNDGILPAKPKEDGVLTEEERELLLSKGVRLAPGSRQKLLDENFLIYLSLCSASERLYVSYPMADEEGRMLVPSILINRLKDIFPDIKERIMFNEPNEDEALNQLDYITTPSKTLSYLASQIQAWKKGYSISPIWWDTYNWYIKSSEWKKDKDQVLASIFYKNKPVSLKQETSLALYGDRIQTSVSRMERFKSCSFSQFISYGLKIKERDIYHLEAPDIGQLFHSALKYISDYLIKEDLQWAELRDEDCIKLSIESVEEIAPSIQKEILLSSHRLQYIKRKLQQVVGRAALILRDHAKVSGFSPVGIELAFGKKGDLPPIEFTLENGCKMEVAGRIDRVDKAQGKNGILLRIIDYKSSQTTLNLDEVYFGLSIQMLTYLDVVLTHSKRWLGSEAEPAGVLYFHVHNPIIQKSYPSFGDAVQEELFKRFKMKGLLLGDEETVRLMDQALESGHSSIVPAALKKSGEFYTNSSIASKEEFSLLRSYVRNLIKDIGNEITNGHIEINPYKRQNKVPCQFCSYRSICQFDSILEENEYKAIPTIKMTEILQKIREKEGTLHESNQ